MAMNKKTAIIAGGLALAGLACLVGRNRKLAREVADSTTDKVKALNADPAQQKVHTKPKTKQKDSAEAKALRDQVRGKSFGKKPKGMSNNQWKKRKQKLAEAQERAKASRMSPPKL